MKSGKLVEIRNPFLGSDGKRYDNSVQLGVLLESSEGKNSSVVEHRILVDGVVRIYLSSLWDIGEPDETG